MHQVLGQLDGQVAPDRARRRLAGVRGTHQRADHRVRIGALHHHQHGRAPGDEGDEIVVEQLPLVLAVVLAGDLLGDRLHAHRGDAEALALQPGDDLSDQAALDGVGLADHQGAVGSRHGPEPYARAARAAPTR